MTSGAHAQSMGVTPHFAEETASAGLAVAYTGDWQYTVGGGVATFDCDGSGYPSALIAGGSFSHSRVTAFS